MTETGAGKQPVVLIIDDQEEIAELLEMILEDEGYNTFSCTDARQAVTCAVEFQPDVIMLDMNMPIINGWQILELLRQKTVTALTPVILMTAASDKVSQYQEKIDNFNAQVLLKPFNNENLKFMVKNIITTSSSL